MTPKPMPDRPRMIPFPPQQDTALPPLPRCCPRPQHGLQPKTTGEIAEHLSRPRSFEPRAAH